MGKVCKDCGEELTADNRYGTQLLCTKDGKERERKRSKNRQLNDRRFYLVKKYGSMQDRQAGVGLHESGAKGLPILTFEEFLEWFKHTEQIFENMFKKYIDSGEDRCLAPSIDRVDSKRGYEVGNLQWLTMSDNARKNNRDNI